MPTPQAETRKTYAPGEVITPCAGVGVEIVAAPFGGPITRKCKGCDDCARRPLVELSPTDQAAASARAFARLPVVDDEPW